VIRSVSTSLAPAAPPPPDLAGPPAPQRHPAPAARRTAPGAPPAVAPAGKAAAPADPLSLAGLRACVEDARVVACVPSDAPPAPQDFATLRARVGEASARLPDVYRRTFAEPLLRTLDELGPAGFARVLAADPDRQGAARLLLDAAQAVLQHGERFQARASAAFQEVVSDLYDGFLSAEARRGVKPPEGGTVPPLVRWGSAEDGPYTWAAPATASVGLQAGVVSLPAANASGGLLAWATVAHETAGHDVVEADRGLEDELGRAVKGALLRDKMGLALADYWGDRVSESSADVLGVLNMGPAAAISLIGYFRAMSAAFGGPGTLRNVGRKDDPHPADIARAYLAAETVRLLSFEGAGRWADRLEAEAERDLGRIRLGDVQVTPAVARESAASVARAIARTRLQALEGRSLLEIQDWTDRDEAIVAKLRDAVRDGGPKAAAAGAAAYGEGAYAAHAVAAGVYEAVAGAEPPGDAMAAMIALLAAMNARNPEWARGARR
jgi:hypothetical protein